MILLILLGCKDDEPQFYETNSKITVKRINFSKFEKADNLKPIFRDIKNLRTLSRDGENSLKLDTINILQATKDSITNYSFKILNALSNDEIKNLVISEKNNELKYYIITYQKLSEDSNDLSLVSSISIPSFSSYTTTSVEISDVLPDCVEVTSVLTASPRWFGDGVEPEVVEVIYDFSNCFSNTEGGTPNGNVGGNPNSDYPEDTYPGGQPEGVGGNIQDPPQNVFPQGAFVSNTENYTRTIQDFLTENNFTETSLESIWVENHPIFANTFGQAIEMFPDNPETVIDILYYLMEHDTLPYSGIDFQEVFDFIENNDNSPEAQNFAIQAIEALMINTAMTFNQILSEQIATTVNIVNNIENNVTNDAIELYLLAKYNNSDTLNLSVCARGSNTQTVGEYTLTPHYDSMDSNANLVFYAAYRNDTNGIEYIIKASDLTKFQEKIAWYTYAADLVYMNGVPSQGQIAYAAGDYFKGLYLMWSDALHSPQWWSYAITSFGTAIANLPVNSTVASLETTPNWNVSLNEMTADLFQGKVVINDVTGISVTINIPENYIPRISDNGAGINFQPPNSVGNNNLIRIMQPTNLYPKGYVRFYNQYGQPMDNPLINSNPGSNNTTHFQFN